MFIDGIVTQRRRLRITWKIIFLNDGFSVFLLTLNFDTVKFKVIEISDHHNNLLKRPKYTCFIQPHQKVKTRKDKWYTYSQLQSTTIKSNIWLWQIKLPGDCQLTFKKNPKAT